MIIKAKEWNALNKSNKFLLLLGASVHCTGGIFHNTIKNLNSGN